MSRPHNTWRLSHAALVLALACFTTASVAAQSSAPSTGSVRVGVHEERAAWPAEPEASATNLSALEPGFRKDLSGAVWNPVTRTLWVCRNGPGSDSRLWKLEADDSGDWRVATDAGRRGEWRQLGDIEGVTFAAFDEDVVYLIVEGDEQILELDVSTLGEIVVRRVYDTRPFLPLKGSRGAEGITFVPDEQLAQAGFVDALGSPRVSRNGMGGLMFVGHQNGGGTYAFDLDRDTGSVDFVGEYRVIEPGSSTSQGVSKVVALEFDRSTGSLYLWHGLKDHNLLSVAKLSSVAVAGASYRALDNVAVFDGPSARSYEGMALVPATACGSDGRALFLTVDDGDAHSLFRYDRFRVGCAGAGDAGSPALPERSLDSSLTPDLAPVAPPPDPWKMAFAVIGGLGIFLIGMKHLSEGMQAIAGQRLRQMINAVTDNRFMAVGVGTGVTCLVQSSSITTVIVVGFVNSGLMKLRQAIGVIMGANIGTTITGWILVLKVGKYGLPILGLSAFVYLFSKRERWRFIAMALMGLGMIFFGLELMKNGVKPMRSVPEFQGAFAWFVADNYLGVLKCAALGCLLTFLVQSSSATLGITISLAATGTIPFSTAAALVLGENIGTTITAWLASLGATVVAKRAAYAHVVFNVVGVIWITLVFGPYIRLIGKFVAWQSGVDILGVDFVHDNPSIAFVTTITFAIAAVHTGFNVTNTALFLGFHRHLATLLERWIPDRSNVATHRLSLSNPVVTAPALSLENSHAVIMAASSDVHAMLGWARAVIESDEPDQALVRKVFEHEARLDVVQADVIEYLTDLLTDETTHDVAVEARQQLRIVDEYESLSDYISTILKARLRLEQSALSLTSEDQTRLLELHDEVSEYVRKITQGFQDPEARDLSGAIIGSEAISHAVKQLRNEHLDSLSQNSVNPVLSMSYSTMLNGYRKVKDHALNIAESLAVN